MIINNKEVATRIKLGYSLFLIIYLLLLVISLIVTFSENYIFEIIWTAFCITAFIVYLAIGFNYIYFNDAGDKILFRYQSLNPIINEPKSIEIPKNSFVKFDISSSFFGIKQKITLYQGTSGGFAKYPSISIASLNKNEKDALITSLSSLSRK